QCHKRTRAGGMGVACWRPVISAGRVPFPFRRVLAVAVFGLLACASSVAAQTLGWNANTESNLAGYRIQYGPNAPSPSSTLDVGNVTSYRFTTLSASTTYYFRVVAYNTAGQVS